jgi:photosystem II CP47 chlorophyll apoprotein
MHTALVAGWAGVMLLYELIIFDSGDPVYNPMWRQGCYVIPFATRLGVVSSILGWSTGIIQDVNTYWTYESVIGAHIILSGACILASFWHWAFWDLALFLNNQRKLVLDLNRIFGIHLSLASLLCFGFGLCHLTGLYGPGMWTSDSFGLLGCPRLVKPVYNILNLGPFSYGVIPSHHIIAGFLGLLIGPWHITTRPSPILYRTLRMGNIEGVLSSSIALVFFAAFITQASMWYSAGGTSALELLGPSRYHWDNAYFSQNIESRVRSLDSVFLTKAWEQIPDKLVFYDYIGCNPAKGGLFRSGPMIKGDGIASSYLGHASFELGTLSLAVRRNPAFFEGFPVILVDQGGRLRADIPFRRAESRWSIEQTNLVLFFLGGVLSGTEYSRPSIVKNYARKALNGEIFTFDKNVGLVTADGVFRTSPRGWYSFAHITLAFIFFFGHLWHASRAFFKEVWTGVRIASTYDVEYGSNEKLGDGKTKKSAFL